MKKEYYILDGEIKKGPYSLDELMELNIPKESYVWKDGEEIWKRIYEIKKPSFPPPPPNENIAISPPPIPQQKNIYGDYEDIAGFDFKIPIILTSLYLIFVFFGKSLSIGYIGNTMFCAIAIGIWIYFKKYFTVMNDKKTARMISWIVGAYVIHYITFMFVYIVNWRGKGVEGILELVFKSMEHYFDPSVNVRSNTIEEISILVSLISFLTIGSYLGVFVSSIRVLIMDKSHDLPLIRIALSSMIMIPIWMLVRLSEAFEKTVVTNTFVEFLLALPFIFLLIHFYRAETEDLTQ